VDKKRRNHCQPNDKERMSFEQRDVEIPEGWSLNAINIVAQKYFTGTPGTSERETSLKHLIDRVVDTTTKHGAQEGYFETDAEAETFQRRIKIYTSNAKSSF
jgi:ribonucleoside-diphosphate reductase alpha chain